MKSIIGMLAAVGVLGAFAVPALAEDGEARGEVKEIIIKVETPDGPRWYSLGADLSKIDIRKGAVIRFNYADDEIESIEVEEVSPEEGPAPKD